MGCKSNPEHMYSVKKRKNEKKKSHQKRSLVRRIQTHTQETGNSALFSFRSIGFIAQTMALAPLDACRQQWRGLLYRFISKPPHQLLTFVPAVSITLFFLLEVPPA